MELMRELQAEKRESREGLRDRAINEALIRGGLTMAASDDPNFLSAAAEGGIGGLAGYQSAMERAAERQGEVTSEMSDLIIAREANDLRRQAAEASATNAALRARQGEIKTLIDMLEAEQKSLADGMIGANLTAEQRETAEAEALQRVEQLRARIKALMGGALNNESGGRGVLGYNQEDLTESQ
jgi:hypothetical protein